MLMEKYFFIERLKNKTESLKDIIKGLRRNKASFFQEFRYCVVNIVFWQWGFLCLQRYFCFTRKAGRHTFAVFDEGIVHGKVWDDYGDSKWHKMFHWGCSTHVLELTLFILISVNLRQRNKWCPHGKYQNLIQIKPFIASV